MRSREVIVSIPVPLKTSFHRKWWPEAFPERNPILPKLALGSGVHLHLRDWDHKFAAPFADEGVALYDFVLEIPRQDQQIIRTRITDVFRWVNRDANTG